MQLNFNISISYKYNSWSQKARVLTENWVADNMYCPRCGGLNIKKFENNRPVADFYCPFCLAEYELKSKKDSIDCKISDGAYETMLQRIASNNNPDFFFMRYSVKTFSVEDFMVVPKHFFVPDIIEKRKPLADTARRAGWTGCNILVNKIPRQGKIDIIKNGATIDSSIVIKKLNQSQIFAIDDIDKRGWLFNIISCINKIELADFSLKDLYAYEYELQKKYPQNNNIQAKIRQQLQMLRDKNVIKFLGKGQYRKIL